MITRIDWLTKPVDVVLLESAPGTSGGFCMIQSNDYYEDEKQYDNEELARFTDLYEAFHWLSANGYAPTESGRTDGVYRNVQAAEWFYKQLNKQPAPIVKVRKESVTLSPIRQEIMLMLSA